MQGLISDKQLPSCEEKSCDDPGEDTFAVVQGLLNGLAAGALLWVGILYVLYVVMS